MSDAPVPSLPSAGLSEERLAEIERMARTWIFVSASQRRAMLDLLAVIARTRSDARLGAALRELMATARGDELVVWRNVDGTRCDVRWKEHGTRTEATKRLATALAALLTRPTQETTT
jgi:hypothetical protein